MEPLIFDTTFLIDFQRERTGKSSGGAHEFLEAHADAGAYLPITAYGEFAEGFSDRMDKAFLSVVESFELLPVTRSVADVYAGIARKLRVRGRLIGANDLWIAATALERNWPLVTRNTEDFARVAGLQLRSY
jgi:tRNA(fMet)-specific endonuclease VapC